jgi:hypothetical protein
MCFYLCHLLFLLLWIWFLLITFVRTLVAIQNIFSLMGFIVLFILSAAIFLLYLYLEEQESQKKLKWAVFKFSVVLMLLVTDLTLEIFLYWIEEDYIFFRGFIIDYLLDFVFVVTVMAMLHIPRSKCCNKVSNRTPLLANSRIQCSYQSFISVGSSQHS